MLPENAPVEYANRSKLWNAVEEAEKSKVARTAREIEIALPCELSEAEQIKLVQKYVNDNFVSRGMCADVAIHSGHKHSKDKENEEAKHDKEILQHNPHAHILLTTRLAGPNGFDKKKNRAWDKRANVTLWRKNWAHIQNREYKERGLNIRVTHESYLKRNIDREPTKHISRKAMALERQGIRTEQGNKNREIKARNKARERNKERERQHERGRDR
jgi:ATP-dependent exoDNAse (exonuclease V) alpha subunit